MSADDKPTVESTWYQKAEKELSLAPDAIETELYSPESIEAEEKAVAERVIEKLINTPHTEPFPQAHPIYPQQGVINPNINRDFEETADVIVGIQNQAPELFQYLKERLKVVDQERRNDRQFQHNLMSLLIILGAHAYSLGFDDKAEIYSEYFNWLVAKTLGYKAH